jgi:hypothetical protein
MPRIYFHVLQGRSFGEQISLLEVWDGKDRQSGIDSPAKEAYNG